jgi:hypothetical protein
MSGRFPKRLFSMLAIVFLVSSISALALAEEVQETSFTAGLAARDAWESWFNSLTGEMRAGAEYWAGQRSLPRPGACPTSVGGQQNRDRAAGCNDARQRLAPLDARRKTDPAFRLGWNSVNGSPAVNSSPNGPAANPSSSDSPWYIVSTTQGRCTPVSDVFPAKGENYPSTPEGIIAGTRGSAVYLIDRPGYGPPGPEHHSPGPLVRLTGVAGILPTLALVQGEASCREVLALLLKAGTSGSAEQRWAAQNAARDAQWHVVYWNGSKVPCVPLAEFIPDATTPEQALNVTQVQDPDAYLVVAETPDQWERILRTRGHNLRLVRNARYCRIWSSLMGG